MKKVVRIFTALMAISAVVVAQPKLSEDMKVTVSTPYKVVDGKTKLYFFDGKESTISVKKDGDRVFLQKFNIKTMTETTRKEYVDFPEDARFQKVVQVADKLYYIYALLNRAEKVDYLYVREIDMNDATFKAAQLLFKASAEVTTVGFTGSTMWDMQTTQYEIYTSYDESKILFRYRLKPLTKSDSESFDRIGLYVYTPTLEKQWGGEVKMPYTEKQINNLAYAVGKNGTVQMLIYHNEIKSMEMLTIKPDMSLGIHKVNITENTMATNLLLREDIDGHFTCTGFISNGIETKVDWAGGRSKSVNVNGLIRFNITADGEFKEFKFYEFPINLINQYESERAKEKNEKREADGKLGINDLYITDLVNNSDGSVMLVGEQQYVRNEYNFMSRTNVPNYYYQDIIVMQINKNGDLNWIKKLPKAQSGLRGKGTMGIKFMQGAESDYIIFVDNPKNAELSMDQAPAGHSDGSGGYLTAYKINDATGAVEKHTIAFLENINGIEAFQFNTGRIFDTIEKNFMLEVYIKGKQDVMIKMELKD